MIEIQNLTRRYGSFTAVDNISLTIKPGSIFGLLGPNGAGKTTTVKCLVGSIKPTSGDILVNGKSVTGSDLEVKRMIGYVPESPSVFRNLTAQEYLQLVGKLYQLPDALLEKKIPEILDRFGLIEKKNEQLLSFSKGMLQKIVIAQALLHNPSVLIFDEPLNGLDAKSAVLLKEIMRTAAGRGKTVVFLSHTLDVVEKLCDEIAILHMGKVLTTGNALSIIAFSGCENLEQAFITLTGEKDIAREAEDIVASLE
jgi:ABC-2 type transport system ATP-binding protein